MVLQDKVTHEGLMNLFDCKISCRITNVRMSKNLTWCNQFSHGSKIIIYDPHHPQWQKVVFTAVLYDHDQLVKGVNHRYLAKMPTYVVAQILIHF